MSKDVKLPPFSINLDNIQAKEKSAGTHNFHPYPAKFIPQIPKSLLIHLGVKPGEIVLDPFSGSGTTLVESVLMGANAIGNDSNPIASLVSKVKSTPLNEISINEICSFLNNVKTLSLTLEDKQANIPEFKNRDHWFQKNMQNELALIKKEINLVFDQDARDFLNVAFSSIIVKCSNQDSDTRWVARNKNLKDGFAFESIIKRVNDMIVRIREFSKQATGFSEVYNGDSRDFNYIADNSIDSVITSPPYLNSFDYYLYHKLRMFWLGYDHYHAQQLEIGSRNKHSDNKKESSFYYENMLDVGKELFRVLKPNRHCAIVIGDSIVNKELIKMDREYIKMFEEIGFKTSDVFSFNQRKYTTAFTKNLKTPFKESHIIIFEK